jgi:hypothetical protein
MIHNTWGAIFDKYLAQGCDYADAAYRADQWEKLNLRKNKSKKTAMIEVGSRVITEYGNGTVIRFLTRANFVAVRLDDDLDPEPLAFHCDELQIEAGNF